MLLKLSKKYKALIILGTLLVLSGCTASKGMIQAVNHESAEPLGISDLKYTETLKEGKVDLVELNFIFPQIDNPKENAFINEINQKYADSFEEEKSKGTTDNFAIAKENYEYAKEIPGADFILNGYQINYTVTTNDGSHLSIFQMFSEFTGGAHPLTYFKAQNYDLKANKTLLLSEIMGLSDEETKQRVLKQVISSIEAQQANGDIIYNETFKADCDTAYNPDQFYLKGGKVIFFYQTYDIAPYAAGLREFEIDIQ